MNRRAISHSAVWPVLGNFALAYIACLGLGRLLGSGFGGSPLDPPFAAVLLAIALALTLFGGLRADRRAAGQRPISPDPDRESELTGDAAIAPEPHWQGARYCPQIGVLCLVTYLAFGVVAGAANPQSSIGETLGVAALVGIPGAFGALLTALAVALPSGAARLPAEVPGSNPRLGRAWVRAVVPVLLAIGVPALGLWATVSLGAPYGPGYLWFFAACWALWATLFVAGRPASLLPAELRRHGPRTLWAKLPPARRYSRPGIPALERWLDGRAAGRGGRRTS